MRVDFVFNVLFLICVLFYGLSRVINYVFNDYLFIMSFMKERFINKCFTIYVVINTFKIQDQDKIMKLIEGIKRCGFNDDELTQCQNTLQSLRELRNVYGPIISFIDIGNIKAITLDSDELIFITRYNDKFYVIDTVEKEIRDTYDSIKDFIMNKVLTQDTVVVVITDNAVYEISEVKVISITNKEYVIPHVEKYTVILT